MSHNLFVSVKLYKNEFKKTTMNFMDLGPLSALGVYKKYFSP